MSNADTFKQRQHDDECKRRLCVERGVSLLEIPYFVPHDGLQEYLAKRLKELKPDLLIDTSPVPVRSLAIWQRRNFDEMQAIAVARGGKLLSQFYIDATTKLHWRCGEGHTWYTIPHSIKRGSWCRLCGFKRAAEKMRGLRRTPGKPAHTIEEMQALAKAKNGVCLSPVYENSKTKLLWRRAKGHEWEARGSHVREGHWCPKCGHEKLAALFALTIDDMKKTAAEHGGECLSASYVNARQKLLWRCGKGHQWEAIGNSVRRGSWCPVCAGKRKPRVKPYFCTIGL